MIFMPEMKSSGSGELLILIASSTVKKNQAILWDWKSWGFD